jgi:hypothetical protein
LMPKNDSLSVERVESNASRLGLRVDVAWTDRFPGRKMTEITKMGAE